MPFHRLTTAAVMILLASCAAPAQKPAPPPVRPIPPRIAPPTVTASSDWRDWPLTPGDWRYTAPEYGRSVAMFGTGPSQDVFRIICNAQDRTITLERDGSPTADPVTIRTTSVSRTLLTAAIAHADGWPPVMHEARLGTSDPLLDAMGFSRGRFVVEEAGERTLVIPAWPEILRVAEDCRG